MALATFKNFTTNRYSGHSGHLVFIGIHTMEAPEAGKTAESVAEYFSDPLAQASAHWCVDNNTRIRCVRNRDSAWTMPPVNGVSLNIELAGYAGQTKKQWDDSYSDAVLANAALCAAEWCRRFGFPLRHLNSDQIRKMQRGFVGHADVNAVFHASDHWDPGPNFPWPRFLDLVRDRLRQM